jgi:eukaryotic-like serine/threonine-protein kinase
MPEGTLAAGRYRLLRSLATGEMGQVWLAADEVLPRQVAIKKGAMPRGLSPAEQEQMRGLTLREARAFARVSHPNVIRILDVLPSDGEPWIVMEYVASRSLLQVIQESGPLTPQRAAAVGLAVLHGLNAAARAGVLHLDVKPANVLIADDGRILLSDFGPAVTDEGVRALAQLGIVLGSPQYIAPERLSGGESTPRADLWSLGATIYHAVEGRPPYARDTTEAILKAVTDSAPDPPARAGPLGELLAGLLRRDPADRLSPAEVERHLRRVAHDRPRTRRTRPPLVRRMAVAATVLAALAALGTVAAATQHHERPAGAATLALPPDFGWWTEPGEFRLAVPTGWRRRRDDAGALVFDAPAGRPTLRVSRWDAPPRDVVAALIAEENDVSLASYRRIRIEARPEPVWEYAFQEPGGGQLRGLQQVRTAGDHTYLLEWQAPRTSWTAQLPRLTVVLDSFGPAPGG